MDFDYLILGNSAAGVSAAEAIRACRPQDTIAIASPEPHPVYGRPLISYLLEGKTSLDRIGYKDPAFYDRMRIATLLGEGYEAVSIDAEGASRRVLQRRERRIRTLPDRDGEHPVHAAHRRARPGRQRDAVPHPRRRPQSAAARGGCAPGGKCRRQEEPRPRHRGRAHRAEI